MFIDIDVAQEKKYNQNAYGDYFTSKRYQDTGRIIAVLSDGLGSGVKANILATLTSKILSTMVSNNIPMEECVETIVQTLPVCKERGVAYSTFSAIHINNDGKGYMFEFDNPVCIFMSNGVPKELEREELNILNKKIYYIEWLY